MKILRYLDLKKIKGVPYSRVHLDRLERAGMFPRRIRLSPATVGWEESEVDAWLKSRMAERDETLAG